MDDFISPIDYIGETGQGFGVWKKRVSKIWNAYPGEIVEFRPTKKYRGTIEGVSTRVVTAHKERIPPKEPHFVSCSPWQSITEEQESLFKLEKARRIYQERDISPLPSELISSKNTYGYRHKMEYHFLEEGGKLHLGFFGRSEKRKIAIEPCLLADKKLNEAAFSYLKELQELGIPAHTLKTLMLRSNRKGEVIAGLFVKTKDFSFPTPTYPYKGFAIYYSDPRSPASVITETLSLKGDLVLEETLLGKKFSYGLMSFFQVDPDIYERALEYMKKEIVSGPITDLYAGVGSIGIVLARENTPVTAIESNDEARSFLEKNFSNNRVEGKIIILPAEKALEHINEEGTLIVDPPRVGLHMDVIKKILEKKPKRILYLSCNIETHARDIGLLQPTYLIQNITLFNFFPRTPHTESLCVLSLKE